MRLSVDGHLENGILQQAVRHLTRLIQGRWATVMRLDALIFGGGAAGLWLLDRLSRDGHHVLLLEAHALGSGQTIASQGIIHSGLKYTLAGLVARSSRNFREMPQLWRDSLQGKCTPDLSQTRLRSSCCYLWQLDATASRNNLLNVYSDPQFKSEFVPHDQRPTAFQGLFSSVVKIPEQVIAPRSFVQDLATQYHDRILSINARHGLEFDLDSPGEVKRVRLVSPRDQSTLELQPRQVIFTAGGGNARLRKMTGLSADVMQRRQLHMVLMRGDLPELNGYCLDGVKTRIKITSERDAQQRMVWQVGGQLSEEGAILSQTDLTERARNELSQALPCVDLRDVEWSTHSIERAEGATPRGTQPENIQVLCAGNVTTGWPTKLALAPALAQEIAQRASSPYLSSAFDTQPFADWPRPTVAALPWEDENRQWWKLQDGHANPILRAA